MALAQLGNTGLWPFALRSVGRQFQDALTPKAFGVIICFSWLLRFHMLSCHSRLHTSLGFFGPLHAASATLPSGWGATDRVARSNSFSMFCTRYGRI